MLGRKVKAEDGHGEGWGGKFIQGGQGKSC